MLESMFMLLNDKFKDPIMAWDKLIEFLATDNSARLFPELQSSLEWLTSDHTLASSLLSIYDPALLKSDYYDYLGDLYQDKVAPNINPKKSIHTPISSSEAKRIAESQIGHTEEDKTILDPAVGTGRLLMAAHKVAPNARLFGVDYDLRRLRIAYANLAVRSIPGYLLHADVNQHELDLSSDNGRHNWGYANIWKDVQDKLWPSYDHSNYNHRHSHPINSGGSSR